MSVSPCVVSDLITTPTPHTVTAREGRELILLIDDDDFIAEIVQQILIRMGKKVLRARNGAEGIRCYDEQNAGVSLVMLDRFLPDLDGVSVCRTLRSKAPNLPIILMSGMDVPGVSELAKKGPTVFLSKPFFASQVRELVAAQLGAIT